MAVVALDVELHESRAEDVSRIEELEGYAARDLAWFVHVCRHEKLHECVDVGLLVQRLEKLLALAPALLVYVFQVALLQKARVAQHHVAQLGRRLAGEDASAEPLPDKLRQVARVVYMGMGEYDVVDRLRVDRKVPVLLEGFLAVALIESAIKQSSVAWQ